MNELYQLNLHSLIGAILVNFFDHMSSLILVLCASQLYSSLMLFPHPEVHIQVAEGLLVRNIDLDLSS